MKHRLLNYIRTVRIGRLLLRTSLAALVVLLLLAGVIAALPAIVSLPSVQAKLRRSLATSLKRPVSWTALTVSWRDGLALRGLILGDGPAPLIRSSVGDLKFVPRVAYLHGRPRVDLLLRVDGVSADLAPGPPKPPPAQPARDPLTAIAKAIQQLEAMDKSLPLDLGLQVAIGPLHLKFRDPKTGRTLVLDRGDIRLAMPSLADRPITAGVRGDLTVDGRTLEGLSLSAEIKDLVAAHRIRPAGAQLAVTATLPGGTLTVDGGLLERDGIRTRLRLDLPRLTAAAGPLLPPATPRVQGAVTLNLHATVDKRQDLHADAALTGTRLALSGGRLKGGRIGPLELQLHQKIASDHRRQQVRFTGGRLNIGTMLDAGWEATVDRPASKDRDLSARLGPVRVDLRQALALAGPLLTKPLPVTELAGELRLQELTARLQGRSKGEVRVSGLALELPHARIKQAKGGLTVDGVQARVEQAVMPLEAMRPTRVDAALAWSAKRCVLSGRQPVVLDGMNGGAQASITDLDLRSRSPRRVSARLDLTQTLALEQADLGPRLTVSKVHEQLAARAEATESGEIQISLPELRLSAGSVKAAAAGKNLPPLPVDALVTAAGIRLPAVKGTTPSMERASVTLKSGAALQLAGTGSLAGGTGTTTGTLRVDLDRALPLAAPFLPKGASAGGITSLAWSLAAPVGIKPPAREKNPLRLARAALGLLERGDLTLTLANRRLVWPLASGKLTLAELRTSRPVRLVLPAKGSTIQAGGEIAFSGLSGLPGAGAKLPPQGGTLSLDGALNNWQSLALHEKMQLLPLGLSQQGEGTVGRLDALMDQDKLTTALLLQRLDATLTTDVTARFPATLTPVPGGVEVAGTGNVGLRLNLTGGKNLAVHATAATRDLGLKLKNGTTVEGMTADLLFDRTYALARAAETGWTPLSASLVRPLPLQRGATGAAELANRVREDLRGQVQGSRRFTIRRVTLAGAKVPLELTALEGDLLLTPEEMGLSFFQTEALGGTLRLRGMLDLRPEVPALSTACSFSNLETFLLLPPDVRQRSRTRGEETAVTGELSLDAPLATGQRELLEGIRMRLNLRRIGRETLERALFSLDPYERNEQVVAQRKLLRNGNLNWLRAGTLDGSFSLEGEVQVKGINVTLPPVERIRLAEMPLKKQMATTLSGIQKLRRLLDLVRADTIKISPEGKISLTRRNNE